MTPGAKAAHARRMLKHLEQATRPPEWFRTVPRAEALAELHRAIASGHDKIARHITPGLLAAASNAAPTTAALDAIAADRALDACTTREEPSYVVI